jgi:hypothetical protein
VETTVFSLFDLESSMMPDAQEFPQTDEMSLGGLAIAATLALSACGGGGGGTAATPASPGTVTLLSLGPGGPEPEPVSATSRPTTSDAARFLTQATFGIKSVDEIEALRNEGFAHWLWAQFNAPTLQHTSYLDVQGVRETPAKATDDMSYEAVWQQWLTGTDQLRARMTFALSQIVVISNIAPDLRPYAMSSYMDMLNRNAFGNYRTLLKEVTLHPAMGYYLNMVEAKKTMPNGAFTPTRITPVRYCSCFPSGWSSSTPTDQPGSMPWANPYRPIPKPRSKVSPRRFPAGPLRCRTPATPSSSTGLTRTWMPIGPVRCGLFPACIRWSLKTAGQRHPARRPDP